MGGDWEYREAVVGDVDQMVEVVNSGSVWGVRELVAVLPKGMRKRFVTRSQHEAECPAFWDMCRVRLPYVERQAKCGIGVGDWVKVVRKAESGEDGWGRDSGMDGFVGTVSWVNGVNPRGFSLEGVGGWVFPYFVLEKVKQPVPVKAPVRTVADLADGEVICTSRGEWLQVLPRAGEFTPCDRLSALDNPYDQGWHSLGAANLQVRPARLLCAPTMSLDFIGKEVFCVHEPGVRGRIHLLFAANGGYRMVVEFGEGDYKVHCVDDLRV